MIAVLDTSAAVEVVLKRESSALFNDFLAEADLVIAQKPFEKANHKLWQNETKNSPKRHSPKH